MTIRRAIFGSVTALLLVSAVMGSTAPTQDQQTDYGKIGWWSITYRKTANLNGCDAVTTFPDQTMLAIALIQIAPSKQEWVVLASNPGWDSWVQDKSQHEIWLITTKRWDITFSVSSDNKSLFLANAPVDFINSIADARSLRIMDDNNDLLTSSPLPLKDSAAAIKAVLACVREHTSVVDSGEDVTPAPRERSYLVVGLTSCRCPERSHAGCVLL